MLDVFKHPALWQFRSSSLVFRIYLPHLYSCFQTFSYLCSVPFSLNNVSDCLQVVDFCGQKQRAKCRWGQGTRFRCSGQGEKLCAGSDGGISDLISETQNDGTSTANFLGTLLSVTR